MTLFSNQMFIPLEELIDNERLLLLLIAVLSSIGALISNLEWLKLSSHFKDEGLFSWRVRQIRANQLVHPKLSPLINQIFSYPNIVYFFAFRVILILLLIFSFKHFTISGTLCLIIAATSIILSIRGNEGTTGADQMHTVSVLTIGLCLLSPSTIVHQCCLIFLTLQLVLAYSTSGWIRIMQPTWRNGQDLLAVLRQHTYGNYTIWKFAKTHNGFLRVVSLSILIFECAFPLALFLPLHFVYFFLVAGILFHISNAFIMGLNTFTWSFLPLYVAFYWTTLQLNNLIWVT